MLSGSLDAFSLPDVFALLAMTKKTGVLSIVGGRTDGRVDFREGEIAYAVSDTRRMALASRLLGGGLVDEEQLRHVVAAQRGGAAALSRVLHDEGLLSPELFDTFVREQIQDAVFELMRLTEGSFSFTSEEADEPVRVRLPSDQLVAEGARRLDEWAQIKGHVISFSALVTLAPRPASESVTVSMEPAQWQLLTFVDGRRTVRDLVDLTGRGEYATCQVIAGLASQGLVEVVDPAVGGRTGVSELVARHELLRRLEERELGAARPATPRVARATAVAPPAPAPVPEPEVVAPAPEPVAAEPAAPAPVVERVERPAEPAERPERNGRRRSEAPLRRDDATPPEGLPALERGPRPVPLAVVEDHDRHEEPPASVFDAPAAADGVVVDVVEVVQVAEVTELHPEPAPAAKPAAKPEAKPEAEPTEVTGDPVVVAYREDAPGGAGPEGRTKEEEDAFDRAEVERELAALGFRTANRVPADDDDDGLPGSPFRAVRPDDNGRGGLLSRLMDGRKQP